MGQATRRVAGSLARALAGADWPQGRARLADGDRSLICLEGIRLAPRSIQRQHQLLGESLPGGILRPQLLKLPDQRDAFPEPEVGVDSSLQRVQSLALEAGALDR
jgi:hypothetical protein